MRSTTRTFSRALLTGSGGSDVSVGGPEMGIDGADSASKRDA